VIKPSSRRIFLENGAGALLAGGVDIEDVFYQSPGTADEFVPRSFRAGRK
jgi:hypothetical protein